MRTFVIDWSNYVDPYAVHPNEPNSDRPNRIMAERFEVVSEDGRYPRIEFFVGDEVILTLFSFPVAIRAQE